MSSHHFFYLSGTASLTLRDGSAFLSCEAGLTEGGRSAPGRDFPPAQDKIGNHSSPRLCPSSCPLN